MVKIGVRTIDGSEDRLLYSQQIGADGGSIWLSALPGYEEKGYADVVALQAAADVAVLPSRHEPYGVSLHEGMAAGCAGLSSDAVGAACDLVVPGETGEVFPAGDPRALARAWEGLVGDPERLRRVGASAQRLAVARGLAFAAENLEAAALSAAAAPAGAGAGKP